MVSVARVGLFRAPLEFRVGWAFGLHHATLSVFDVDTFSIGLTTLGPLVDALSLALEFW